MATKKKSASKSKKSKSRKAASKKKQARKQSPPKPRGTKSNTKKSPKKNPAQKQSRVGGKALNKKAIKTDARRSKNKKKPSGRVRPAPSRDSAVPRSGGQSGDLQGLSDVERADSESVDELIEEGNAFEAGIVTGVEEADDHEGREVHTREIPQDDVPGEYHEE